MSDRRPLRDRTAGVVRRLARSAFRFTRRGRAHFERVEEVPYRVTVSGVRGKSTVVRWLNEALVERGLETYAKVTGDRSFSYHGLDEYEIERDGVTRLYENERELRAYWPVEAAVVENQGIREYTTRLANELFDPHVVVLLNVRRDHQSTLGDDLTDIARAFARTAPEEAVVISGDRNDAINDYLRREFDRQGVEFRVAEPPPDSPFADTFGAQSAFVVDETLRALGLDPLNPGRVESLLTELQSDWRWRRLAGGGLVCNGAMMNDIESTELLRQHLTERLAEPTVTPFLFTRRDRSGRTAAFVHYLDWLADADLIDRVHVAGTHAAVVERRAAPRVIRHDLSTDPE
ncbi:poly-gamma-glutamate synthase PgsB [Haloparvum alkalitolerans]|uniref:capsule biosynthesis protein CapB n=1 Tax=Haloparvum alkalitolerans TaxID=1042953 RepID=UPI003CF3358E